MKASVAALPEPVVLTEPMVLSEPTVLGPSRLSDFLALAKLRVAVLVLFTVGAGVLLAAGPGVDLVVLFHAVLGTALVAAGASALNQLIERHSDALMRRTENRPLPSGRLQPVEVGLFGMGLGVVGVLYLAVTLRQPCTPLLAAFTFVAYVGVYTPLKRRTTLNTLIGAVPGALPPVIGWTAVHGTFGPGGWCLFAVVFIWQVPHFLAIAWMYREDYGRAGLRMLPVEDPTGSRTARSMVLYAMALIPVSLAPAVLGVARPIYLVGALALGGLFLASTLGFAAEPSFRRARRVLRASLFYLPGLLALLLLDNLSGPGPLALWP